MVSFPGGVARHVTHGVEFCRTWNAFTSPATPGVICRLHQESEVIFVDMRGSLGDTLCTDGDVNYDLSKVYQSLCGYDFMIMDKELDPTAVGILRDLEEVMIRSCV